MNDHNRAYKKLELNLFLKKHTQFYDALTDAEKAKK